MAPLEERDATITYELQIQALRRAAWNLGSPISHDISRQWTSATGYRITPQG